MIVHMVDKGKGGGMVQKLVIGASGFMMHVMGKESEGVVHQ